MFIPIVSDIAGVVSGLGAVPLWYTVAGGALDSCHLGGGGANPDGAWVAPHAPTLVALAWVGRVSSYASIKVP